jgi:serine/threonine-protein kinase
VPPERWSEVKSLFARALEHPPAERWAFLDKACPEDADLRAEVESLLEADKAADHFLETGRAWLPGTGAEGLAERLRRELADRYTIERELGHGGMATVYLAQDRRHERAVALKVLNPELAFALGPERFQREIRTAARLQHPHILGVHDSGDSAGRLWYTTPLVEGGSLRDRLKREKQLPLDEALGIARDAARALDYAHRHGIIHRDIKPENILLTREGDALIADFGIGRAFEAPAQEERITAAGAVVGTPAYMSPEQAAGERELDGRTDIYSLGVVLYEMLVGELPFGPTAQVVTVKRARGEVPPRQELRPGVPPGIEQAVVRALAPVPADRWPTAAEFARALGAPAVTLVPQAARSSSTLPRLGRRRQLLWSLIALGALLLVGGLWLWRRDDLTPSAAGGGAASTAATHSPRLAVLPFENLGRPEEEYFADGVTDEVRGKLTALPGLQVIARASSNLYKGVTKPPRQVGEELGVDYLLTGTVRWQNNASSGTTGRVQVRPELVEVGSGVARWEESFEAELSDIFEVQAQVGERVAQELGVALGTTERERFEERPTRNLAAYDAYLKGNELFGSNAAVPDLRRAIEHYERAVALDSVFALAWARLGQAYSVLVINTTAPAAADLRRAVAAADRALRLAPGLPQGHLAMGDYYLALGDRARSREHYALGLERSPNNVELLTSIAHLEQSEGDWEAGVVHLRRAQALDPRSWSTTNALAAALLWLRRYPEALEAVDRAIRLAPERFGPYQNKLMVHLAQGNLAGARSVLDAAHRQMDSTVIVAEMGVYWDLYWVLDEPDQALLLRLTPAAFGDDTLAWGLALAGTHSLRGDAARARAYADSARRAVEARLKDLPENAQMRVLLGLAQAYLGNRREAVREAEHGTALVPMAKNAWVGAYLQHQRARVHLLLGNRDRALDQLEPLLRFPYYLSPGWLRIDPTFDALRGDPRFQRLMADRT